MVKNTLRSIGMVTLQQIAERASLSRMAVSMALRNHPRVSAATKERVQALAREMGYRPNPLLGILMSSVRRGSSSQATVTLAFISGETKAALASQPHRSFHPDGVKNRALALGYKFERFWLMDSGMNAARLEKTLLARNIQGIVFGIWDEPEPKLQWNWDNFACGRLSSDANLPLFHSCESDLQSHLRMAWEKAKGRGFKRIAMVVDGVTDRLRNYTLRGTFLALQSLEPARQRVPLYLPGEGKHWSQPAFTGWMRQHRPDIVLAYNMEIYDWLLKSGWQIPDEVSFIFFGGRRLGHTWSCVVTDNEALTANAVDLVDGMLHRNDRGVPSHPHRIVTRGIWHPGDTFRE